MKTRNVLKIFFTLLLFTGGAVYAAGDSVTGSAGGVSKKDATSKLLPKIPHAIFADTILAIDENRRFLGRKLAAASHQLFPKSSKADSAKSAKAYSKGQKEDESSSLFTSSCSDVQAKLDVCEAAAAAPHWLFVQIADMCTLYRKDGVHYLESSKFHKDTEWFTDRPMQLEETQPTDEWFANFNEQFDDGKGMPNAALTIVDDDESKDVVVSVFAEGYVKEGGDEGVTTYGYKLEQSAKQASVVALDSLMNGEDSVTFDHCSMFIDDFSGYCIIDGVHQICPDP